MRKGYGICKAAAKMAMHTPYSVFPSLLQLAGCMNVVMGIQMINPNTMRKNTVYLCL